jgi:hypothetical protein
MNRITLSAACLAALLGFGGCKSTDDVAASDAAVAMGMVNRTCPISGKALTETSPTVEYDGYKVGLCCAGCTKPWSDKTAAEKSKYVADQLHARH